MFFGSSVSEPLKPLQDEIADSKLGQFAVGRQLYIYQPILPSTTPPSTGADILFLKRFAYTYVRRNKPINGRFGWNEVR